MIAVLATFFADPWFDVVLGIGLLAIAYCTVAEWRDRSRHIDAVLNTLLPEADEPDLDRRIAEARRRNQAAFEDALGLQPRVTDEALHEWMGDAS